MLEEIVKVRQTELLRSARTIERRMEWEQISRVERLERALKLARGRLRNQPALSPQAK